MKTTFCNSDSPKTLGKNLDSMEKLENMGQACPKNSEPAIRLTASPANSETVPPPEPKSNSKTVISLQEWKAAHSTPEEHSGPAFDELQQMLDVISDGTKSSLNDLFLEPGPSPARSSTIVDFPDPSAPFAGKDEDFQWDLISFEPRPRSQNHKQYWSWLIPPVIGICAAVAVIALLCVYFLF